MFGQRGWHSQGGLLEFAWPVRLEALGAVVDVWVTIVPGHSSCFRIRFNPARMDGQAKGRLTFEQSIGRVTHQDADPCRRLRTVGYQKSFDTKGLDSRAVKWMDQDLTARVSRVAFARVSVDWDKAKQG
jgi:hypothetical protein